MKTSWLPNLLLAGTIFISCTHTTESPSTPAAEVKESTPQQQTTASAEAKPLPATMEFPEGFRNWHHIKSMILQKGHPLFENFGGIHHIYANDKAYEGYLNNKNFPDGSVIVFDLLEAVDENNAITEGRRKVIGVMYKNSSAFPETGGWEFGAYKSMNAEKLDMDWKSSCFSCHASKKDVNYVFSDYRE